MLEKYLEISKEVSEALKENKPVVALESTIISHGMPYPKNAETALNVEKIIRDKGAIPATIAILNGKLKVGLTKDEIEYLGKKGKEVVKTSRRDIPFILAKKLDGATTVASTMIVANLAGIKVFGTGGIGGVHRGAQESFDISADLQELANTDVAVVCAGAKSILDIGLTLEYLETQGVPVVGFGTEELPAFYTRKSGFKVDYKVDTAKELAEALKAKWDLGLKGGMVVGNPIPEEYQMNYDTITKAINDAVKEAEEKGIKGKESTPFLLAKVKDITKGKSLEANIQLVYNNVAVASDLAIELSKLNK
ncbi:pseudouridine-5'-phosphate glycosidase [Clostridium botulinum]|uniref:Pseudouridine-5'-phosphate glycosidase n=1 Tax=Clostridium botulinum (strain Hall / ATCC 3502 / NCTC 13319 / Type A) TaxID=441771 RepID=A5I109_CLOBH|nr:pseudouridine-5'-phosphate glycosidase [Clostridium botulinum]EPS49686.1 indigoidine synthase A family protein [Clostridium botulinum CFSAN002369]EPS50835.1 indigoidine synthase A family protein [Clostridium botulinum CFSAN002367]ABS34751.1 indigoidine synthase A family protein [Clostridium botulinum A str. ATCC 19397]ABS39036.1 indigoidine synthase A family protein [Clostridium botulinum A str. Hall]APQ74496.1 indigoidine synthase A like family protein [Clostridium botulinum]